MTKTMSDIVEDKHAAPAYHYIFFGLDSVIHEVAEGNRNVEQEIAVDSNTSFHAFSVTKTFTAVAVMQLVSNGSIELGDSISEFLPAFTFSAPVTIKHLLSHQSGIVNPLPLRWTHLTDEHVAFNYRSFSDSIIMEHLKLKRAPGRKYAYSNINYLVLGRLIEQVSGLTYQEYITRNILKKLPAEGFIGFDIPETNHATGYHPNSWFQNILLGFLLDKKNLMYEADDNWNGFQPFYNNGAPYGGIISTPSALKSFCQELLRENGNLLPRSSVDTMLTEQVSEKGKETGMCLGWFKGSLEGKEYFCHAGGGGGYYSEIRVYPEQQVGSVIMLNSSGMSDDRLLDHLDQLSFKSR